LTVLERLGFSRAPSLTLRVSGSIHSQFASIFQTFETRSNAPLLNFGLIKKVSGTYRYYLTRIGRSTIAAACRISEQFVIPALAE
jgi:hypothetical protein